MKVSEALNRRISVRQFLDTPVPVETIERVLTLASRAPSGGNVQPWKMVILGPEKMTELRSLMETRLSGTPNPNGDAVEYQVYPDKLKEPYRTARFEVGEEMYALLGISREEKQKRLQWLTNNYRFFDAPAAAFCFVDKCMGSPQWSDLGMYLQSAMLLFQEEGIDTCAQEIWCNYPRTVHEFCDMPEELMLFCGLAIGYRDESAPVNQLRTKRLDPSLWLKTL